MKGKNPQKLREILQIVNAQGKNPTEIFNDFVPKLYSLLLDKFSPAPNSPNGEQKSTITKTSEQKPNYEKWTPAQQKAIELAYEKTKAKERGRQDAKSEGERERQEIKTHAQAQRRGMSQKTSMIDMGDSAGVPEEYIF